MGELILQVDSLPSQEILEKNEDNKSGIIEYSHSEFDISTQQNVQMTTDNSRNENENRVTNLEISIPSQLNHQTNDRSIKSKNDAYSVSVSITPESDNEPQDESSKNPPRKRKEVVFAPPPYEIVPPQRPKYKSPSFDDLPPPYDPSLRRSMISIISLEDELLNDESSLNESNCNLGVLIEAGFCFCSIEQIIVTTAIIGIFIFLGLSY